MSIKKLANEAYRALETKERDNGESFQSFKRESPDWMKELARHAHSHMLPDDIRYDFIAEVLEAINQYDDIGDAKYSIESDVYTHDLTEWLHSRIDRSDYVDQAISEFGKGDTLINDISSGQLFEKLEVFDLVLSFLNDLNDESESESA